MKSNSHRSVRRILLSVLVAAPVAASGCVGASPQGSPGDGPGGGPGDGDGTGGSDGSVETSCADGSNPFDLERMTADLTYIASDELGGRGPGTMGDTLTREFIAERFRCLGLTPAGPDGSFQQPFVTSEGVETANVVGYIRGTDLASEAILIGAHHDHLGLVDGVPYNGANDNGSGVVAVLAVAQSIAQRATPPRRSIVFVTFGFEEHIGVCEGSEFYARNPPAGVPFDDVVYMVDGDMLGTYPRGGLSAYGSVPGTPGRDILDELLPGYPSLNASLGELPDESDSDFQAFCDRGIPYVYLETWDPTCYHDPCDDINRIDFPSLSLIAQLLGDIVDSLADSEVDLAGVTEAACP